MKLDIIEKKIVYKDGDGRRAEIVFYREYDSVGEPKDYEFSGCDYKTLNEPYSLEDWRFLKSVCHEIEAKLEELNK